MNKFETIIPLLKKDMQIIQRADHFSFSLDSLLVSEFATLTRKTKNILDIGTGNGVIPLFLSRKTNAKILGVEIQEISAELARRNVKLNNIENIEIINDDIKNWNKFFKPKSFDLITCNPPFFKYTDDKMLNERDSLTLARHEITIKLEEIIQISSELLKDKGYFTMVHRVDRMIEIIELMKKYHIEPKKLRFCYTKIDKEGKILLIEGVKFGNAHLRILPPLIANKENGEYSDEVLKYFE